MQQPQPMQPHAYWQQTPQQPPQQQPQLSRKVFGVDLEMGERVLYFRRNPTLGSRIGLTIVGILFVWLFGLGIFLLYLAITDRKQSHYAQAITNRRLLAIDGHGHPKFQIRWEQIAGMNKVAHSTGLVKKFGVRNAAGEEFLFLEDCPTIERVISQLLQNPSNREMWPEVPFQPHVD